MPQLERRRLRFHKEPPVPHEIAAILNASGETFPYCWKCGVIVDIEDDDHRGTGDYESFHAEAVRQRA